jgi:hypothetical protein
MKIINYIQFFNKIPNNLIFSNNNILFIKNYNDDNLFYFYDLINFYKKLNINIFIILFYSKKIFITPHSNIKIIDKSKSFDKNTINNIIDSININKSLLIYFNNIENYIFQKFLFKYKSDNLSQLDYFTKKNIKIFINYKYSDIPFGGGNQFVYNFINYIKTFKNIEIINELQEHIDLYFLIDLRKSRDGIKNFSFEEVYNHKKLFNHKAYIFFRINDCDITRENKTFDQSILLHFNYIDYFIFNSNFIKQYFFNKYTFLRSIDNSIILNTCNNNFFFPKKFNNINFPIQIVTHHWSDNINKGYDYYYKLNEFCIKNSHKYNFTFIGRKFNENFDSSNINCIQPLKNLELANEIRKYDIYISASIYDACPMHVLEGISCGLPILYIDHEGGGKEICELTNNEKIGEKFSNFNELIEKLDIIINNYQYYYDNILNNINLFNSNCCYSNYLKIFLSKL